MDSLDITRLNLGPSTDAICNNTDADTTTFRRRVNRKVVKTYDDMDDITHADSDDEFVSADEDAPELEPGLMYGDNGRPQLISSGNACLDLFGTWIPSSNPCSVDEKLQLAWDENNLLTLKVMFHKGNTRDGGSGDFLNFIRGYIWLFRNHPKTALENVKHIPKNSSLQTLLLITKFLMYDQREDLVATLFDSSTQLPKHEVEWHVKNAQLETHKISTGLQFPRQKGFDYHGERRKMFQGTNPFKKEAGSFRKYRQWRHIVHVHEFVEKHRPGCSIEEIYKVRERAELGVGRTEPKVVYEWVDQDTKQEWVEFVKHKNITANTEAKRVKNERKKATRQGIAKFVETHPDGNITKMVLAVRDIFVDGMVMEINQMLAQDTRSKACNGLFHKWAPTRGGSMDRATNLGHMIQQELIRRISVVSEVSLKSIQDSLCDRIPGMATMTPQNKYTRILRMMRKRSFIPESFVGAKRFHELDYTHLPGKCLSVHGATVFKRNDKDRYEAHFQSISDKLGAAFKSGDAHTVNEAAKSVKVDSTETHMILGQALDAYRVVMAALNRGDTDTTHIDEAESKSTVWKLQFINLLSQFMSNKKDGSSWIPVVDTSGSMDYVQNENILAAPIDVAVTLGLLVSMTNDPLSKWFCRMVTFNQRPDIYHILHGVEGKDKEKDKEMDDGASEMSTDEKNDNQLEHKLDAAMAQGVNDITGIMDLLNTDTFMLGKIVAGVKSMPWGGSTDLIAVFKKQLEPLTEALATKSLSIHDETLLKDRIANENMIIFTDMQFDDSDGTCVHRLPGKKNPPVDKQTRGRLVMEEITTMYSECGIDKVPKIVFWNLNAEVGAPSGSETPGVTMVTGFSAGMLQCFLADDLDGYNPTEYLVHQMDNEAYSRLIVCD
jgi:hypothetical protein